jgi:SAM-dependent methyltransferase
MSEPGRDSGGHSAAQWPAGTLGKLHGQVVHRRRVMALAGHFADLLPQDHSVLDVGCGDGLIDRLVLERRGDLSICGVDVLVRQAAHIAVTQFDGRYLPCSDQSFDSVLFCDVLHHTESPLEMLREAVRVARHSILIKDHVVQGWLARPTLRFMDFVGNAPHGVALPYNYFTAAQWDEALRECCLSPRVIHRRLGLYPAWADVCFGRSLHFIGLYDVVH